MTDLDLSVELVAASGARTRLGSEDVDAENIPQGISFGTRLMHGFGDVGLTLSRRIDGDYADLGLLDEINLIGGDGSIAYEGRIGAIPRSFDNQHSVSVQGAGWMSHCKDRKFTGIYVDRDLSQWGPMSIGRRTTLIAAPVGVWDPQVGVDGAGTAALRQVFTGAWAIPQRAEAWYDAGPVNKVAKLYYDFSAGTGVTAGVAAWDWYTQAGDDDVSPPETSSDLSTALTGSSIYSPSTARRYFVLRFDRATAPAGADGTDFQLVWTRLAAIGDHGLPVIGTAASTATVPLGVAASDVIKHLVGTYCPMLNTAAVAATTYPIPHLVFRERTTPYDAFLEVNKYHLWDLSCWENRTLHYGPLDYTDYDWEIRTDTEGTIVGLQGDSIENLASGIVVQYTSVLTGKVEVITPDEHSELRDDSADNPFNAHGYPGWTEYQVSFPTTEDAALQMGRMALAEFNAPKAPGTITKTHYIRDRAGHMQPVWKVRAGDRVAITSSASLSDRPRVIHETTYSHDSRSLTMSVEGPMPRQESVNDRITTALAAAGLT